ncbi:hypothetical protein SAMN02745225_00587 [Ferrithrix thermotolerans DSM 19514]|uniref:Uncharacterized protein n=1 Tax=Ferrithrix thermotolerans DSM 19514 TaxID=1121881 RepID=A0A1M4TF75_9ACTN|nr:hypothetical protein [Ferrithrix thermotolerans]SHE43058.1 hypothetical protein SAMN02745225_00587 [Ferrithrix thermotolerans DSM 19514]
MLQVVAVVEGAFSGQVVTDLRSSGNFEDVLGGGGFSVVSSGSVRGRETAKAIAKALGGVDVFVFSQLALFSVNMFSATNSLLFSQGSQTLALSGGGGSFGDCALSTRKCEGVEAVSEQVQELFTVFENLGFSRVVLVLPGST